jgi:hypothetical protein
MYSIQNILVLALKKQRWRERERERGGGEKGVGGLSDARIFSMVLAAAKRGRLRLFCPKKIGFSFKNFFF